MKSSFVLFRIILISVLKFNFRIIYINIQKNQNIVYPIENLHVQQKTFVSNRKLLITIENFCINQKTFVSNRKLLYPIENFRFILSRRRITFFFLFHVVNPINRFVNFHINYDAKVPCLVSTNNMSRLQLTAKFDGCLLKKINGRHDRQFWLSHCLYI